ncbi:MAG: ATP-binding protein [Proteobacteria bacterium]|nr:ATP-binding protein [Pseudomonadota bacterium]
MSGEEKARFEIKARSLFTPAAPISKGELFNGRLPQIGRIIKAVFDAGRHVILFGERGVGKTSLGNALPHLLKAGDSIKVIRVQSSPNDDYEALWGKVFSEIWVKVPGANHGNYGNEETVKRTMLDIYKASKKQVTPNEVVNVMRGFAEKMFFVTIFDEYDCIQNKEARKIMAHTIKALSDAGVNVTIVLIGVADDINALVEDHQSVNRNIEEIRMPRMNKGEMEEVLDKRLPTLGMAIENDAKNMIVTLSRGLPEYVHILGRDSVLDATSKDQKIITIQNVREAVKAMLQYSDQSASNSYRKAVASNKPNALYKKVILACAMAEVDGEGQFNPAGIVHPLRKISGRGDIDIANFQPHLSKFCSNERGNILERRGRPRAYKYRFREPKMQPFIIMKGIKDETIVERDALLILQR